MAPNPTTSRGGGLGSVTVSGTAAAGQAPIASSASAAAWAYPPGYEIGYAQITANVNIASTTEATGTTIISSGALVFDGGLVMVEFFSGNTHGPTSAAGDGIVVSLFESSTQITRLCQTQEPSVGAPMGVPLTGRYRFTPSAASHTYTVTAFVSSTTGTPFIGAGAGGTAAVPPAFLRFTKV